MSKDKALEELFLAQKPHFDDNADFMAALTRRLDAVEYVRRHQEATIRRYKIAMVAAFVIGVVSGAISLAFVLSLPADMPLFTVHVQSGFLLWLAENSRVILSTVLALLMSLGLMSIISNVSDILHLQKNHNLAFQKFRSAED
ncbi:MAG: hypothetical protein IJK08_00920 [Prevotella sp.]|nr:hypothetical protein [Prevotella sp.]